jgi:hypothetical protein
VYPPVMFSVASSQANDNLHDELIARTRKIWRRRVGPDLSRENAFRMALNVTGFFCVLAEWSRAEKQFLAASAGHPTTHRDDEAHQAATLIIERQKRSDPTNRPRPTLRTFNTGGA